MENNDKAKRILFGRTDIGGENGIISETLKGLEVPYDSNKGLRLDEIPMIEPNIPVQSCYDADKQQFVDDELHFRGPETWIKIIRDYCHDNNCSPQDLIRCHKWATGRMPIDWKPQD